MSSQPAWEAVIRLAAADVLSLNQRKHWAQATGKRRAIRQLAEQTARLSRAPHLQRARLVIHVAFPDRRRRDPHNFMATAKPIVDGLVDAGVLPDDDHTHLAGPDMRAAKDLTVKRMGQPVYEFRLSLHDLGQAGS